MAENAAKGAASAAAPTTFRGKPISWQVEREMKPVTTHNVFGEDNREERPGRKTNRILYEGQLYTKEGFYKAVFPDYKRHPFKVQFFTDDIYRLGSNQRARLQYHILAQRFPLVDLDEADKRDLEIFAARADTETAQRWLNRMRWSDGHEKMVTFGASLEVADKEQRGRVMGLWCYKPTLDLFKAVYQGVSMTWEDWAAPIVDYLKEQRERGQVNKVEAMQGVMYRLYYQDGLYLTVPQAQRFQVVKWAAQFMRDGVTPFPLAGDMGSDCYEFTIDFEQDTSLKKNKVIHDDMGAYNVAENAAKGQHRTEKLFAALTGDKWRTKDLKAQGFSDRNIRTFEKHGLIKRQGQGQYVRVSK